MRIREGGAGRVGNRQVAWHALKKKYACCAENTRRTSYKALVNSWVEQGRDPDYASLLLDKFYDALASVKTGRLSPMGDSRIVCCRAKQITINMTISETRVITIWILH